MSTSDPAKIRVAIRVRPLLETELRSGLINSKIETTTNEVQIKEDRGKKAFKFDHVFPDSASQQQLYRECEIDFLIQKVIEGYHATIFAYGQTGSGKTYTMEGNENDGLIPTAIYSLFNKIKQQSTTRQYTVCCSFLQIYNEKIYDLLANGSKINAGTQGTGLRLRWSLRDQFQVENLFIYECKGAEEVLGLFRQGVKNRITASHKLNLSSSRSHSILELKVESVDLKNPDNYVSSKLELVDLAGSERISQTGAEGKQARESIEINKSLMTLRQVIATLSDSRGLPPYRDSKLTCLLKQSIGGNSYCLMIACVVPADMFIDENVSTLNYATKAAYITNKPIRNDDPKNQVILDLKNQIAQLTAELTKANDHIDNLTELVQKHQIDQTNDRLVDSINMVRELLLSNQELRERDEQSNQRIEVLRREIMELQKENFDLRERSTEDYQPSPPKMRQQLFKKNSIIDDTGFLPEQATQFQRNLARNVRASSQRARQLPLLRQQQQLLEEGDELTNFGRRTLYQKGAR